MFFIENNENIESSIPTNLSKVSPQATKPEKMRNVVSDQ